MSGPCARESPPRTIDSFVHSWRNRIDHHLSSNIGDKTIHDDIVRGAMHHAVQGGHRWRPLLLIAIYEALTRASGRAVIDAACGLELIHCCSVIIDDLPFVDGNSMMRRGLVPCHEVYGEAITVYSSHILYGLGERLARNNALRLECSAISVLDHLGDLRSRLVQAQVLEMHLTSGKAAPDYDTIWELYTLKSSPFVSAAWLAVMLSGVEEVRASGITEFARLSGISYQLLDDIIDAEGDLVNAGKPVRIDKEKINFVRKLGIERSHQLLTELRSEAETLLDSIAFDASIIRKLAFDLTLPPARE